MKRYVNNWAYELNDVLPAASTTLPIVAGALDRITLDEGDTLDLTIAAGFDPLSEEAEVITLTGQPDGTLLVTRDAPQDWAAGSVVFASLPAGHLNEIQFRLAQLEQGSGGGITVGDAPAGAPSFPGEAILAYDGLLYIGHDTGDVNGWDRFEPIFPGESTASSYITLWDAPTRQRIYWTPDADPLELGISAWSSGLDSEVEILLDYPGTAPLVVAGYLSGVRLMSNVAITNNGDGTASIPVGALQMLRVSRRAETQTVAIIVEPLQALQF